MTDSQRALEKAADALRIGTAIGAADSRFLARKAIDAYLAALGGLGRERDGEDGKVELRLLVGAENVAALEAGQDLGGGARIQLERRSDGRYSLLARARKGVGDRPPVNYAAPGSGQAEEEADG